MSSLAFLSKKSWHTGLQSNQERVWKAEKAALAERRKVDELRKERDRERELQELQRMQAEAGGGKGKHHERVDWMYNAPAGGSNIDKNELEDYLLGKKRVDKLLQGDEKSSLSRQGVAGADASFGPPQAGTGDPTGLSGIQSDRDVASKIREDPMFAIRQQEQAAYQALLKDPVRLREMRKKAGLPDKEAESKEERRRRKEERRRHRDEEERHYSRSDRDRGDDRDERRGSRRRHDGDEERYARSSRYRDDRDAERRTDGSAREAGRRYEDRQRDYPRDEHRDRYNRRNDSAPRRDDYGSYYHDRRQQRSRSRSPSRYDSQKQRLAEPATRRDTASSDAEADRAARLAAMQQNAVDLSSSRKAYLDNVQAKEAADEARDEALRAAAQASRRKGGFGKEPQGAFLIDQQRSLHGSSNDMDLAERLRRGRDGLQRFRED